MDGSIRWGDDRRRRGAVLGMYLGRPIVTNGDFLAWLCESDTLFPNDFVEDLYVYCIALEFYSLSFSVRSHCVVTVVVSK